ncbi:Lrp/AsnC family transcriptional regulator [Candidatus Altiarchaeota archaeon]
MVPDFLDKTDLSIIQLLLTDSRISQKKIASRLNIPLSTIQKRLQKLRENAIERFTVLVDPEKLGLATYLMRLTTDTMNIKPIIDRIKGEDSVSEVYYSEDGQIIVKAICSGESFINLYENVIGSFGDKIRKSLLLTRSKPEKHTPVIGSSEIASLASGADKKRKADLAILNLLADDSRLTLSSMAGRLDVPLSTLQKKIKRLTEELIDQYTVVVDPKSVGLETYMAHITMNDDLGMGNLIEMLAQEKCVSEIFHRDDGEIFMKSFCTPGDFIDFYSRLRTGHGEDIKDVVLLSKPVPVKHTSVIHPDLLDQGND